MSDDGWFLLSITIVWSALVILLVGCFGAAVFS